MLFWKTQNTLESVVNSTATTKHYWNKSCGKISVLPQVWDFCSCCYKFSLFLTHIPLVCSMPVVQWFPVHLEAFPKHLSHGKKSLLVHQKCCNVAASLQGITIHHALVQHQLLPWLYVLCRKHPSLLKPSPTKHQFAMVTQSTAAEETESTH